MARTNTVKVSKHTAARKAWLGKEGARVHVRDVGTGLLVESRDVTLGCRVALEAGGTYDADAAWLTMCEEQY